jgi:hypothetical protein
VLRHALAVTVIAPVVLLAGCASAGRHASPSATSVTSAAATAQSMVMAPGAPTGGSATSTDAPGHRQAAATPSATALMVCSDDIKTQVTQVLKLASTPATRSTFGHGLYTCTYTLPYGPLLLSVQQSTTNATAATYFTTLRPTLGTTDTLPGLGEKAYGTPTGTVVVIKDNMTLTVNATHLPAVFGTNGQKRTDLAYEIASDVLGCWTGNE